MKVHKTEHFWVKSKQKNSGFYQKFHFLWPGICGAKNILRGGCGCVDRKTKERICEGGFKR